MRRAFLKYEKRVALKKSLHKRNKPNSVSPFHVLHVKLFLFRDLADKLILIFTQ